MNINPQMRQLLQTMCNGGNPQQMVLGMMQQRAKGNPFMENLLKLAQSGNTAEIEEIARNMVKEKGLDYDKEFNSFKNTLGFK